jgi:conjugative transfer signal peptidase TraF
LNKFSIVLCVMAGTAAAALPAVRRPDVRLVYNASASAPLGWYLIRPATTPQVGDYVLATLPGAAAALAAQRGYLPLGVPILKQVGAVEGQHVCITGDALLVDGAPFGRLRRSDSHGRSLIGWPQCRRLSNGELMLLSTTNPASFDSRYFGPVSQSAVRGKAVPLWTWSAS